MCAVISVLWKWMYLPKKADVDLNVFEKITGICFEKDIVWKEIKWYATQVSGENRRSHFESVLFQFLN